jgi:hypothetical protein
MEGVIGVITEKGHSTDNRPKHRLKYAKMGKETLFASHLESEKQAWPETQPTPSLVCARQREGTFGITSSARAISTQSVAVMPLYDKFSAGPLASLICCAHLLIVR